MNKKFLKQQLDNAESENRVISKALIEQETKVLITEEFSLLLKIRYLSPSIITVCKFSTTTDLSLGARVQQSPL